MLATEFTQTVTILTLALLLLACGDSDRLSQDITDPSDAGAGRWYSEAQLNTGRRVFSDNCANCHGINAEGTVADWQRKLADGSFPPPPLNGTAHAWHHPRSVLLQVINEGGVPFGGKMPAFDSVLTEAEKLAVIAYFQSFWGDEIYQQWGQMGGIN